MVNELNFFSCSALIVETGTPKFSQNINIINMTVFTIQYLPFTNIYTSIMCLSAYEHKLTNFARTILSHVLANLVLVLCTFVHKY